MDRSGLGFKSIEDLTGVDGPTSESFWDIGNYRKVVKRVDDGLRLCNDFIRMGQERAEIEAKYAKSLQAWSKKWDDCITKGPEYGTLEVGWKSNFTEAVKIAEIHMEMSQRIIDEAVEGMLSWKNSHFHKSLVHLKESKRAEEGFSSAQRPWSKKLFKCIKAKKTYHQCAREEESLLNQVNVADTSMEVSAEQVQKLRAKHDKAETDRDRALEKYKDRIAEVQRYKTRYDEDMTIQFSKCQDAELARMEFFKQTFFRLHEILNITTANRLNSIYADFEADLESISPDEDLRWYAVNYGTGMSYNWPEFEPYITGTLKTPSLSRPPNRITNNGPPSMAPGISHLSEPSSSNSNSPIFNSAQRSRHGEEEEEDEDWLDPPPPMEDEEPMSGGNSRSGSEEPQGKLMRALYDYTGQSGDDLNFKEGDLVRIMFEGEDGWAEGTLGDKYGYVPISYFEAV